VADGGSTPAGEEVTPGTGTSGIPTDPTPGSRIGIFGGTFDPVHFGHLAAAEEARWGLALDRVVFVPNWHQPLKRRGAVSPAHRLAMVELAIAGNASFATSDVELRRAGSSYTLDTLRALRQAWGSTVELFFLLGADAVATFGTWHRPAEILELAHLVVMSRSGEREPDWDALERIAPHARQRVRLLAVPALDISATDLRARLAKGGPIRYQVPDAVCAYIARHGLYKGLQAADDVTPP
jgi:nicotinate-nucleotide adenylyltransferase